ncbi:HAUS augmin-like complex subunit 6 [Odontesthes bonariensis]|uniref:HAUS augmin-like complex subunit 6 n=1 Tax=Odontesthes bonariensis TaxID=219752 RepID=UPI003F58378E
MTNAISMAKENGQFLWFALLGMGFDPDIATNKISHLNLGPNMFDKRNKDAFYIVTHFLLEKLNPTRFHEAYRHCWPVLSHKADAEFRKVTCTWLREIMDETGNAGSKVVASWFLSPGGPKFTSLMVDLASHVMVQEMKTFTTDGSWVPEAAAMSASTLDMAVKRFDLVRSRFLKAAVDQDRFLHSYQRKAQVLVKSIRDHKADLAKYDELLKCQSAESAQSEASFAEKMKKVRSLWSDIAIMLSTIKNEQNAVESVLKGDVDQYVLDGADQVLKIPRCLLDRVEQLPHQLTSGNVYEAGQLNLLVLMELMNHALQLLKEQRCQIAPASKAQLCPQLLQEKSQQMVRVLQDIHLIREKISKEEIPEVKSAIRELETNWDKRWMDILREMPLVSFLNDDPALGFLSPMAPLSFEPATETIYRSSVFSQYAAKLPEEEPSESEARKCANPSSPKLKSPCPVAVKTSESPFGTIEASRANTSLDWLFDTPSSPHREAPCAPPPEASVRKTAQCKLAPKKTKTQILDLEYDNLADEFVDAITTTSPSDRRVKGLELECLFDTLQKDPFSTKKQLPRTPESLIMDVKSSWRKAVEEDEARKLCESVELNSSLTERLSPLSQPREVVSTDGPSQMVSCTPTPPITSQVSPSADQQGVLLKSTLSWDTFDMDSPSGTNGIQFSLNHETLPEMSSCDSLLFEDEAVDIRSEEDEELLIPSLKTKTKPSPLTTSHLGEIQQASTLMASTRTTECLVPDHRLSGMDGDLLMEYVALVGKADEMFPLDLDSLETPSPPKKQEYSPPKLITFSPVDDMKR